MVALTNVNSDGNVNHYFVQDLDTEIGVSFSLIFLYFVLDL